MKGAFGTLLLVLLYPLTCLVLTLVSFCLFVTAPLWTFAVSFIYSFFFLNFIYDRSKPGEMRSFLEISGEIRKRKVLVCSEKSPEIDY